MRVLHINTAHGWRGGEQQVLYLMEGLRTLGIHSELAAPVPSPLARRVRDAGMPVRPVAGRGDLDLPSAWRLRRAYKSGFDVVHVHTGHAHALALLAGLALPQAPPLIVSRRVDFPIKGGKLGRLKYGRRVERFIPISYRVRDVLLAGGVPAERMDMVYSGVRPERFAEVSSHCLRRELGLDPDVRLIAFIGALVDHKAPADLLAALERLPDRVHVVLAGDGPNLEDLRRQALGLRLRGRVHFLGHRDDVPVILQNADLFCVPSRMEGLGTSVLDAMAAGVPVVATHAGGIPEMVEPGHSGLLVSPGRPDLLAGALAAVLEDPPLARRLVQGGRERVRKFSVERMVEGTLRVYEAVLAGSLEPVPARRRLVVAVRAPQPVPAPVSSAILSVRRTGEGVDAPS